MELTINVPAFIIAFLLGILALAFIDEWVRRRQGRS